MFLEDIALQEIPRDVRQHTQTQGGEHEDPERDPSFQLDDLHAEKRGGESERDEHESQFREASHRAGFFYAAATVEQRHLGP